MLQEPSHIPPVLHHHIHLSTAIGWQQCGQWGANTPSKFSSCYAAPSCKVPLTVERTKAKSHLCPQEIYIQCSTNTLQYCVFSAWIPSVIAHPNILLLNSMDLLSGRDLIHWLLTVTYHPVRSVSVFAQPLVRNPCSRQSLVLKSLLTSPPNHNSL